MKSNFKFLLLAAIMISSATAFAQASVQEKPLPPDRQSWVEQVSLYIGQNVKYKTNSSDQFVRGRVSMITDSTISFEDDIPGLVITVLHRNLVALKIYSRRGTPHVGPGIALMVGGGAIMLIYPSLNSPGESVAITIGALAMAGGLFLIISDAIPKTRTIVFGNSWKLSGSSKELRIWR